MTERVIIAGRVTLDGEHDGAWWQGAVRALDPHGVTVFTAHPEDYPEMLNNVRVLRQAARDTHDQFAEHGQVATQMPCVCGQMTGGPHGTSLCRVLADYLRRLGLDDGF